MLHDLHLCSMSLSIVTFFELLVIAAGRNMGHIEEQ